MFKDILLSCSYTFVKCIVDQVSIIILFNRTHVFYDFNLLSLNINLTFLKIIQNRRNLLTHCRIFIKPNKIYSRKLLEIRTVKVMLSYQLEPA
jgi:hypothetical protein